VIQEAHDGRLFCELNGNQGFVISFFLDMEKDQSVLEDCMICNEKKILFRTTYACEDTCCQDCISNHVKAQLERNNLRIQCLACKELMKIEDLQRVLPRDVFSLYEETSTIRSLSDDPKYVSCLNPKCGVGQVSHFFFHFFFILFIFLVCFDVFCFILFYFILFQGTNKIITKKKKKKKKSIMKEVKINLL